MMNAIWAGMMIVAIICGALSGNLEEVAKASTDSAKGAVTLALGLVGVMCFWLGMMQILNEGGFLKTLARWLKPVMKKLFPEIPADHPAMSMMILNISSNMLGMANAATPFGIKAMNELSKLNPIKGTATNSMALFLAINTSGLALLPTGMIAIRASLGSQAAGSIFLPTIMATSMATITAILAAKFFQKRYPLSKSDFSKIDCLKTSTQNHIEIEIEEKDSQSKLTTLSSQKRWALRFVLTVIVFSFAYAFYQNMVGLDSYGETQGVIFAFKQAINQWPLVILMGSFIMYGLFKGVNIYDALIEGGREGFSVALKIIPFLVGILVAVGMLRASGAIGYMIALLEPITSLIGLPAETLPMALLRPLSGSGAFGISSEIMTTHGPDSLIGNIVSTMQGSTETTFYVLAVYYGAIGIKNTRHTVPVCLMADAVGLLVAAWSCHLLLG